jgi:tRNA(Arg) A34 adenosine deaminase TadA
MTEADKLYMRRAISVAEAGMRAGAGGPFGCVIVRDGVIIAEGHNEVTSTNDPTAHAEVVAIRRACKALNSYQLDGCVIYASCEPCPMCLGAIYWARPARVFFGANRADAANIDFDDNFIYQEVERNMETRSIPFVGILRDEALRVFNLWAEKMDKQQY